MNDKIDTYLYSTAYSPAMPVVEIGLTVPNRTKNELKFTALIDTGSDGTLIPRNILEKISARYVSDAQIYSVLGDSQWVEIYLVNIHVSSYQIQGVRVVASDSENEIILGRNVLNHLIITLNGLANVTEISR